jgi:FkbM family methyltransferase
MSNLVKNIIKSIAHPILVFKYLKSIILFNIKHKSKDIYELDCNGITIKCVADTRYLKRLCFDRPENEHIHEPAVVKMLMDTLKKDDVFVDVGAHVGYFSFLAGKMIGADNVYSFDANRFAFDALNRNKKVNNLPNIHNYNYAVTDCDGEVKIPKTNYPYQSLAITSTDNNNGKYTTVKSVSLDSFFQDKTPKPNVLKIDAEGADLLVLKGMEKLLEDNLTIFLELHGDILHRFNTNSAEVISYLADRGYYIYEIQDHRRQDYDIRGRLRKIQKNEHIDYNTMCYVSKEKINQL